MYDVSQHYTTDQLYIEKLFSPSDGKKNYFDILCVGQNS